MNDDMIKAAYDLGAFVKSRMLQGNHAAYLTPAIIAGYFMAFLTR